MTFAIFRCCATSLRLQQYEQSTNAVLKALGIQFTDVKEFNCCGYPLRNYNYQAYLLAAARNLALAEQRGMDLLTCCNCCFGSLKKAAHHLALNPDQQEEINRFLAKEGLTYSGTAKTIHFLQYLHDHLGLERLQQHLIHRFHDLDIATHYGCHVLRPKEVIGFDSPFVPSKFDDLVQITGARSIAWPKQLDCCGSPVFGVNDELSMDLTQRKLASARQAGAALLCVACPYCQLQFDRVQRLIVAKRNPGYQLPSLLYPQLLGLCLGLEPEQLGIDRNALEPVGLVDHLHTPGGSDDSLKMADATG